jgi:hypothetical protein
VTTVVTFLLAVVFGVFAAAKLAAVPFMRSAAAHLGFTVGQYRVIGLLELAGAAGLVVGRFWVPIGLAAGIGLVLLMAGAAAAHAVRRDPPPRIAVPVILGALTAAYVAVVA